MVYSTICSWSVRNWLLTNNCIHSCYCKFGSICRNGVFLPLITTNCVVLGVAIVNIQNEYSIFQTIASAFGASVGFTLALLLLSALRERLELANVPKALQGFPMALIAAGLMSIAFTGFAGLV